MKLVAAILFLSFVAHLDACKCSADITLAYNVQTVTVQEPTDDGTASTPACGPIDCTTTVTVTSPANGTLYGGTIMIVDCSGISAVNVLTISNGDRVLQNFTSCPTSSPFNVLANTASTIKFHFNIQQPIGLLAFVQPMKATVPPTTPPPSATTTPYNGDYPHNPMTHRVDLIVALDLYKGSKVFDQSKQFLQNFANIFAYNSQDPWISYQNATHPYARLSLMGFDGYLTGPFATGTLPWSLDQTSLATSLGTLNAYSAAPARVFQALNQSFNYMKANEFTFRQNTQSVLVYFAGYDCDITDATNNADDIKKKINEYNLKVIVVNMDNTKQFSSVTYPCLSQLTGDKSNNASSYNFQGNSQPDLKMFVSTVFQNGNKICNNPSSESAQVPQSQKSIPYQIPTPNTPGNANVYCNYMNNVQKYAFAAQSKYMQVLFKQLNMTYGSDSITIDIDGTPVASLSGQYGFNPYYCLPNGGNAQSIVGVTFKSSGGKVLSGFTSYVTIYDDYTTCSNATTPAPTPSGSFAENSENRLMPLNI
uniref:VWFA domain-containing protein n=1 Tax=Panagrolaimus sp. JU765 TaxID=591449 RepID=A0AC34QB89_9BILA